jgi:excisionase family DNA binding protein
LGVSHLYTGNIRSRTAVIKGNPEIIFLSGSVPYTVGKEGNAVREIPLSDVGLVTVEEAAAAKGCDPSTVRRWASRGNIPVIVVGKGRSAKFLLRKTDVDGFTPPPVGYPTGKPRKKKG